MKTEELVEELTGFFNTLREDGMIAIALSESEKSRMKLLGLMQYATRQEISLKRLVKELENELNPDILLESEEGVDLNKLAEAGTNIKTVKVDAE